MTRSRVRRAVKNWLPQEGRRVEVRHPVTGRMWGVSDHAGFAIVMTIAIILIIIAIVIGAHG
jgi:hypothetical protein